MLQNAGGSWFIPIVELAGLFSKVLSNFCRNLAIGHLVNCFNSDDASSKTFFELSFCFARPEEQDGVCVAKLRDYLIIIYVEMAAVSAVLLVFPRLVPI
jgi:hypothetical protein